MFYWNPDPDLFVIPLLNWSIKWYGFFFAFGFLLSFPLFSSLLRRYSSVQGLSCSPARFVDRLSLYLVIGMVLGARLGHFLFYENPQYYLHNLSQLLWIREGGLASHGGAVGILLALWLFCRKVKEVPWLSLLDLIAPCAALVAVWIRIGNFFNQEIIGTPTSLPWAVIFGHPLDGSLSIARHPAQLYEALCYLFLFFLLWRLSRNVHFFLKRGFLLGLFLVLCFGSRFFVECFKQEPSMLLTHASSFLSMGQWLSIPFILFGVLLIFFSFKSTRSILLKEGDNL